MPSTSTTDEEREIIFDHYVQTLIQFPSLMGKQATRNFFQQVTITPLLGEKGFRKRTPHKQGEADGPAFQWTPPPQPLFWPTIPPAGNAQANQQSSIGAAPSLPAQHCAPSPPIFPHACTSPTPPSAPMHQGVHSMASPKKNSRRKLAEENEEKKEKEEEEEEVGKGTKENDKRREEDKQDEEKRHLKKRRKD